MFATSEMCESSQSSVTINGIDPDAMSELIEYAYTCRSHFHILLQSSSSDCLAEITICENNVQALLSAANLLMMQPVRDACSSFFERFLDETNAIGINCFAELHGTQELTKKAKRFVLKKFSQVSEITGDASIVTLFCVGRPTRWMVTCSCPKDHRIHQ